MSGFTCRHCGKVDHAADQHDCDMWCKKCGVSLIYCKCIGDVVKKITDRLGPGYTTMLDYHKDKPRTPGFDAACDYWLKVTDEVYNSELHISNDIINAFQAGFKQARQELLDKLTAEDGGNEFALVCHLKEKLADARRDALEEAAQLIDDHRMGFGNEIRALLNKNQKDEK